MSTAGLVGGGSSPRPGEVSLAHHGVLFLDELLEFPRHALEALRQPLEDGRVVIARASSVVAYPARFTLIAAMNPCKCSYLGHPTRVCSCSEDEIKRYRSRLSGPLLDHIDLQLTLNPVPLHAFGDTCRAESSAAVRNRVEAARERQRTRYAPYTRGSSNAQASGRELLSNLTIDARHVLHSAAESLPLSARGFNRVVKVARTIADLAGETAIAPVHVAEGLRYRSR